MTPLPHALMGLGVLGIGLLTLRSVLSDFWKLALLIELPSRQRVGIVAVVIFSGVVALFAPILVGTSNLEALLFLLVAFVPTCSWQVLTWWAWYTDCSETRSEAMAIALERAARFNEPPPRSGHWAPWKDYVFDVEAARRRSIYEPPPI
jgi:hypothetical protein